MAREVGAAYHDMSAKCGGQGRWQLENVVLPAGVYYANCGIELDGSNLGGRVTLVAEGVIWVDGSRPLFEPYHDGVLFLSGSTDRRAIEINTEASKFLGVIQGLSGKVTLAGSGNRFYCGIYGDTLSLTGSDLTLRGANCGRPDSTVSGPVLVPNLAASLGVDRETALPSQALGYDLTVTNRGASLVAPALIGLENVDTVTETVTGYDFALERLDAGTGEWVPLASKGDEGFRIDLRPNAFPGVLYPEGGGVAGTTVDPGGWATWGLQSVLDLSPAVVESLLDPAVTAGIRTRVDFELTPTGAQARRLFTVGDNFIEALRALSADVTDADATLLVPSGDAERIGPDAETGLAGIAPGESVTLHRTWDVPVPSPRGAGETDAGYLARLKLLDGSILTGGAFVLARGGVGQLVAPLRTVTSRRTLPVVDVKTTGPAVVIAGTSADYDLDLANVGSSQASELDVKATAATNPLTVTGAPTGLTAGERATAGTTYQANATPAGGTVPLRGTATWKDAAGNSYGATGSTVDVTEQTPAKLQASLADMLVKDVGNDGATSPGDTVRYTAIVRNTGDATMTGVSAQIRLDPNTGFVPGSGVVQNGTLTHTDGDTGGVVQVTLPDVLGNTARTITFDAVVADPFPGGLVEISAQGTVKADGQDGGQVEVLTDDLTLPGPADPTTTPVIRSFAALAGLLSGRLVVDSDGNGVVSAGDTLAYQLEVNNVGTQIVTGISLAAPTPTGTTLVDGSVTSTHGTVTPGPNLSVDLGTMGPLSQAVVEFRLKIDQPLAAGISAISMQANLHADQIGSQLSDDPATAELEDPTVLPVGTTGGGGTGGTQDGTGPTIGALAPAEGSIVTEPVHITATLSPPEGQALDAWVVDYRRADDTNVTVLQTGTGGTVDTVFDPTILPNGTYVVTVRGTLTNGGLTTREITIVVDGEMKLGRYTTTLTDMTVGVAGLPIQVQRSYDSFDKTTGDFGVGWSLDLTDFQVSSNGPLGEGGWKMESCGGGLIFSTLCFTSDRPHFVTVTWPDGHNEYFDLTPAQGSTFFTGLTTAQFTARPGTTSKLAATDNNLFYSNGNLNGGAFGSDGVYNPTRFVLTDKYGTKYTLEVGEGLKKIEDRVGNVTTFTRNGITSSNGPSVTFTRDANDVITKVTGPDGKTVEYGYDGNGDLVSVTNQLGKVTTLTYLADHYLDRVTGPDSAVMARYEYQDGRIVAVIDGEGNRTEISSDVAARQETVTDPGGKRTTIRTFDEDGLLIKSNEVYSGLNHVTEFGYDDKRNMTFRRDPSGNEWHATYQDGNVTSLRQPSGATTTVTYNSLGAPLTWTDPEGQVTTYTWNADGTLAGIEDALGHSETYTYTGGKRTGKVDRNGNAWAWTYTAAGLPKTERDPLGNVTAYEYDANGRETAVIDALGHRSEWTYDAAGNLRTTKNADGMVTENVYDDLNRLVRTIDPTGAAVDYTLDDAGLTTKVDNHEDLATTFGYDGMGRETSRQDGSQAAATSSYDGAGNLLTSTDEVGRTTTNTYYPDGKLHTTENPAGGVTTYTYTPDGQLATVTDPRGKVTRHTYWPSGRLRTVTDPTGATTGYAYDAAGRLTLTTFADGTTQEQRYDAAGNVVKQIDQEGDATSFEYDDAGRVVAQVDGESRRSEFVIDEAGRTTQVKAPGGGISQLSYSPAGLLESETTSQGVTTTYGYDPVGRRTSTTNELGHVWSTTYDALGRVLTERDPRQQGTGAATVTNVYDDYGNFASTTDALGHKVSFGYDAVDQRTSITDPRGKTWTVDYDALGNPQKETDPLGRVSASDHDNAGLLQETVDARGTTVAYGYDDAGRLTSMTEQGGTGSITYAYDELGRRAAMTDASGQTTWDYYPDGATRQVTAAAGTVTYAYDRSGLRTSMTTPAGTTSYSYDAAGNMDTVIDADGRAFDLDLDSDGRARALARPNGVTTTWTYDDAGRLTGLIHKRGTTVVDSSTYTLDADGNRTRLTTPAGIENYTLNAIDQLSSVSYPDGTTTTYTYDPAGNRLMTKTGSAPAVFSSYDDASQLTSVGGDAVTHDAAGHVTAALGTRYDWDWLGRMIAVSGPAVPGGSESYSYDGDGMRVGQDTASGDELLLYDRLTGDGAPDLVRDGDEEFLHLFDGVVEATGTDTAYPLTDGLGSVRTLTGADGTTVGTTSYDAFGAVRSSSGSTTTFGFTGAPQTGDLLHLNQRDLDTRTGRFLSTDPVRPGAPGAVGWNQYSYVANNPTTLVDPTGGLAVGYAATLRPAVVVAPTLPVLAFAIVKPLVLTGAFVGTAALVADRTLGPDEDANQDEGPDPDPVPVPFPIPYPMGETINKPRPGDCTINGASWYNYWGPNSRPTGADACLKAPLSSGSGPGYDPPGWQSGAGYDRGHIIGRRLGGSGTELGSLFTQCLGVNRGALRVFEGEVAGKVNAGETVYYAVALGYFGRVIPDSVSAFYAGSRGSANAKTFSNVC